MFFKNLYPYCVLVLKKPLTRRDITAYNRMYCCIPGTTRAGSSQLKVTTKQFQNNSINTRSKEHSSTLVTRRIIDVRKHPKYLPAHASRFQPAIRNIRSVSHLSAHYNFERANLEVCRMSVRIIATLLTLVTTLDPALGLRFPVTMPYVSPQLPNEESYLCTGVAVQNSR